MDILSFLAVCVIVIPLQLILYYSCVWTRQKIDNYEQFAKYNMRQQNCEIPSVTSAMVAKILIAYENIRVEIDPAGIEFRQLPDTISPDILIELFKKINIAAARYRKRLLIEAGINRAAATLRGVYGYVGLGGWIRDNSFMGSYVEQIMFDNWLEKNPIISMGIDMITGLWIFAGKK